MTTANTNSSRPSAITVILIAWLIAGTLDISAAYINVNYLLGRDVTMLRILQYLASSVFHKESFNMGWNSGLVGLAIHYTIALCFTLAYFFACRYIAFLRNQRLIAGLLYGIVVWAIMNLIVLYIVFPSYHFTPKLTSLNEVVILMLCIGLPIGLIIPKYYEGKLHGK